MRRRSMHQPLLAARLSAPHKLSLALNLIRDISQTARGGINDHPTPTYHELPPGEINTRTEKRPEKWLQLEKCPQESGTALQYL